MLKRENLVTKLDLSKFNTLEEINIIGNYIFPTEFEKQEFFDVYKQHLHFSFRNLENAKEILQVKGNKKNIIENVLKGPVELIVCISKIKKNKFLKLKIGNKLFRLGSIVGLFECQNCSTEIKIHCYPTRDLLFRKSLLCESCLKQFLYLKTEYQEKYKSTMRKRWGAESTLGSLKIREKIQKTMIERYGVPFSAMNPILYQKSIVTSKNNQVQFGTSKIEESFCNEIIPLLKDWYDLTCNSQYSIKMGFRKYYILDIFCEQIRLAIEFFGDYFHGNPEIYSVDHPILFKKMTRLELNRKDEFRINLLKAEKNIDVFIVWEKDWRNNKSKVLLSLKEKIEKCLKK